jgi:hypothetical protein
VRPWADLAPTDLRKLARFVQDQANDRKPERERLERSEGFDFVEGLEVVALLLQRVAKRREARDRRRP